MITKQCLRVAEFSTMAAIISAVENRLSFCQKCYLPACSVCALFLLKVCVCTVCLMLLCIQEIFFCLTLSPMFQALSLIWRSILICLSFNYSWHKAFAKLRMRGVIVGIDVSCPAAKLSRVTDISETFLTNLQWHRLIDCLCLPPTGLSKSAAEGLDKTHQESTQTWPQLQLQTHPSWLQERRQWQVGVCLSAFCSDAGVCVLVRWICPCVFSFFFLLPLHVCWLSIQVTVDICALCCQYIVKTSESWLSNLSLLIYLALPLFFSVIHDESPLLCCVTVYHSWGIQLIPPCPLGF